MLAALPWLKRLPAGDGHPVIVFPGLGAADITTAPLRSFLQRPRLQHLPVAAGLQLRPARRRARRLPPAWCSARPTATATQVSLVGWSLGGVYAREMAKELPDLARCVDHAGHALCRPPARHQRLALLRAGQRPERARPGADRADPRPAGVPTTSIYTQDRRRRGLAVQHQRSCAARREHRSPRQPHRHGHEPAGAVRRSPTACAQDPAHWKRFDVHGARRWFFKTTGHWRRSATRAAERRSMQIAANGLRDRSRRPGSARRARRCC